MMQEPGLIVYTQARIAWSSAICFSLSLDNIAEFVGFDMTTVVE
jgi:hypothetical protein